VSSRGLQHVHLVGVDYPHIQMYRDVPPALVGLLLVCVPDGAPELWLLRTLSVALTIDGDTSTYPFCSTEPVLTTSNRRTLLSTV
jgi:hypothetical protein